MLTLLRGQTKELESERDTLDLRYVDLTEQLELACLDKEVLSCSLSTDRKQLIA